VTTEQQERPIQAVTLRFNQNFRDPLGRKAGEPLDALRHSIQQLQKIRSSVGERVWSALYQQTPRVEGGNLFDRAWLKGKILKPDEFARVTEGLLWCRYWDWAFSIATSNKTNPDYTVGCKMAFKVDRQAGTYSAYIADMVRFRGAWSDVKKRVKEVAADDAKKHGEVWIGGEGGGGQKAAMDDLVNDHAFSLTRVLTIPTEGKAKKDRAQIWLDRAADGMLYLQDGKWVSTFIDEAEAVPNGAFDDTVDAVTGAWMLCGWRSQQQDTGVGTLNLHSNW
jgi:predicted phage terminase large subunit-like protein